MRNWVLEKFTAQTVLKIMRLLAVLAVFHIGGKVRASTHSATSPLFTLDTRGGSAVPVYRFYSYGAPESTFTHLWTINDTEKDVIMTWPSWQYEGTAWHALLDFTDGSVPLYRLYEPNIRRHLYTISATEYTYLETAGWNGEGAQYYVYAADTIPGLVPVYRFYHSANQNHHFTIDANETDTIIATPEWGYTYEDVVFYVFANRSASALRREAEISHEGLFSQHGVAYLPPADYTGNGLPDRVIYDETTGFWYILPAGKEFDFILQISSLSPLAQWGGPGFVPFALDYNGDGISDLAVYHEETGTWYITTVDGKILVWGLELE